MTVYSFQYAAKFLCISNIPGTSQTSTTVVPGSYQTAVNIHNPHGKSADLRMKIALGDTHISQFVPSKLGPDGMTRVTCNRILREFFGGPEDVDFIHGAEGFLVIESTHSLDVVAVYTAAGEGGQVQSLDVETVKERRLEDVVTARCKGEKVIDLEAEAPGPRPNPWSVGGLEFRATAPPALANLFIQTFSALTGLNCANLLEVKIDPPVDTVELVLVHFSRPATVVATSNGSPAAPPVMMVNPQGVPESIAIAGANIDTVQIRSPQNEVLLLCLGAG